MILQPFTETFSYASKHPRKLLTELGKMVVICAIATLLVIIVTLWATP